MRLKHYPILALSLLCLPAVLVPVKPAEAQTTIKVSNPQNRSLPLLMLNATSGANVTGLTGSAVGTAVAITQSTSSGSTASGATSLLLTSATGFPTSGSVWVPTQNGFVTYTGVSTNTLTGIPASGAGSITATIPTATLVTTGKAGSISVQWTYNLTTSNVYPAQGYPALGAGSIIENANGQYEYIPTAYETALPADLHFIFSASNVSDYNAMLVVQTYKVDDIGPQTAKIGTTAGDSTNVTGIKAKTDALPIWPANFANLSIDSSGRLVLTPAEHTLISATDFLGATVDGSITVKQQMELALAVITGKYSLVRDTVAKTVTTTYKKADGTTTIAVSVATFADTNLTQPTGRTWTFSNL